MHAAIRAALFWRLPDSRPGFAMPERPPVVGSEGQEGSLASQRVYQFDGFGQIYITNVHWMVIPTFPRKRAASTSPRVLVARAVRPPSRASARDRAGTGRGATSGLSEPPAASR